MVSIMGALARIKGDVSDHLSRTAVEEVCRELDHTWRSGPLDPANTVALFIRQVAQGNVSCEQVRHLADEPFTAAAYCQARQRLPLEVLRTLSKRVCGAIGRGTEGQEQYRWLGHKVHILDGTSFSMPDTPELREHFGQPTGQKPGCGFPVGHALALFDAKTGVWEADVISPLYTGDVSNTPQVHGSVGEGDVVLGDDSFSGYAHVALLFQGKKHVLVPNHHRRLIDFTAGRPHLRPGGRNEGDPKGLPTSRWICSLGEDDQLVEWFKPGKKPEWMNQEQFDALPESIVVREARRTVRRKGFRPLTVTVITTLLDEKKYPADELVKLRMSRWGVETDLRHLKTTMGMDVLRCESVEGVKKEVAVFQIVYNLVRVVMMEASRRQQVGVDRISFADALAWVRYAQPGDELSDLVVNPYRPGRVEPRAVKRRPKEYDRLTKPRKELQKALKNKEKSC
jgi:hypothetical protein